MKQAFEYLVMGTLTVVAISAGLVGLVMIAIISFEEAGTLGLVITLWCEFCVVYGSVLVGTD